MNKGFKERTIAVMSAPLDLILAAKSEIALIKIDVEGHELSVLKGALSTIRRVKPSIIVESEARHHPSAPGSVFEILKSEGYDGFFIHKAELNPLQRFSVASFQAECNLKSVQGRRCEDYVNNFIFLHPSRQSILSHIEKIFPAAVSI